MENLEKINIPSKVTLKLYRKNSWLPEDHDGSLRFTKTREDLTVQASRGTGILNTGLDSDIERELEKALSYKEGTLSKTNKEFWGKFRISVSKDGLTLFPKENPYDELIYRVCLAHQEIAESESTKDEKPFSRYILASEEDEIKEITKEFNAKLKAYEVFGKMSQDQKINFLITYGKNPGKSASIDFVNAQVGKLIDQDPEIFVSIISNPSYDKTVFIKKCVNAGVLKESGGKYFRPGGEVIGYSLEQTIDFLSKPENNEVYISIKGQLEATK